MPVPRLPCGSSRAALAKRPNAVAHDNASQAVLPRGAAIQSGGQATFYTLRLGDRKGHTDSFVLISPHGRTLARLSRSKSLCRGITFAASRTHIGIGKVKFSAVKEEGRDMIDKKSIGMGLPRMLRVGEAADFLHVHPNTLRKWSSVGLIPSYRLGHRRDRRFRVEDLASFLNQEDSEQPVKE